MATPNTIKDSEHMFICGGTGSGKSVLAEAYCAGFDHIIKVDIKDEVEARRREGKPLWRGLVENEDFEVVYSLEAVKNSEFGRVIYVVPFDEQTLENYDDLCLYVYQSGNMRLWVDELMLFTEGAMRYPKYLKAILVSGRSRNATLTMCTQRPMGIPAICIANSQHYFVFSMGNDQDRKKMADATGCKAMAERPPKYAFWYYREGDDPDGVRKFTLKM